MANTGPDVSINYELSEMENKNPVRKYRKHETYESKVKAIYQSQLAWRKKNQSHYNAYQRFKRKDAAERDPNVKLQRAEYQRNYRAREKAKRIEEAKRRREQEETDTEDDTDDDDDEGETKADKKDQKMEHRFNELKQEQLKKQFGDEYNPNYDADQAKRPFHMEKSTKHCSGHCPIYVKVYDD